MNFDVKDKKSATENQVEKCNRTLIIFSNFSDGSFPMMKRFLLMALHQLDISIYLDK